MLDVVIPLHLAFNFTGGSMLEKCASTLNKINSPIAKFTANIAGNILVLMTFLVLLQVGFRYVLNSPLSWTDESSRYLMIYMTYLSLPIIYLTDKNIAMTFVTDKFLSSRFFYLFMIFNHVISLIVFVIWIYYGFIFFETGNVSANSLPIPMYTVYIVPPIMMSVCCSFAIQKLLDSIDFFINFEKKIVINQAEPILN